MLAPVIARSPCLTSPSTAAPPRWPGARVGEPTPCWAGCTPTMPRALTRSRSAAPAAAVPFLPAEAARALNITLMPLPGYSPDLMPVEALWRWLREDVTYHHCHASAEDLTRRVAAFAARLTRDPFVIADRLWVKDHLDPEEEKLRFSN